MKIEKLQPNMIVYDVGKHKMGNTNISTVAVWPVRVISIDLEKKTVLASWNTNQPRTFYERSIKKWRADRPVLIKSVMGYSRLATCEERKKMAQQ